MTPTSERLLDFVKRKHWHLPNCNSVLRNDITKCDCEDTLLTIETEAETRFRVTLSMLIPAIDLAVHGGFAEGVALGVAVKRAEEVLQHGSP